MLIRTGAQIISLHNHNLIRIECDILYQDYKLKECNK